MAKRKQAAVEIELLSGQRNDGESNNAVVACNDYLRIGAGRTLPILLSKYGDMRQKAAPTQSLDTLQNWSRMFDWQERATAFDATWEARKNAEREAVMGYGLSLDYERVRKLVRLADFLEGQIYERDEEGQFRNVWVPDVKSIGGGDNAERVDIERFNSALLEQYRSTLDDLAKEVGGRIKKADVTSGGKAIPILVTKMDMDEL